ncbi:MAG: hypothetical protein ABSD79_05090 [Dehalococcoidales bacterium]|jgi:hypothetical protein
MKVLKALASTLLSLLLFICLIVMGVAVTLNSTALNAGFITGQIDKLDVVTLFNEEALPTIQKDEQLAAHPEVITSIQNTVEQNAPALKNAVNKAISDIYGYLLHGETLDLRQTLKTSVLDPQLAISILNDIDLSTFIHDLLIENVPLSSAVIADITVDLTPYTDSIVAVIQPWFKEQVTLLIPKLYDYVLGDSSTLDLNIPVSSIITDIGSVLKSAVLASPPPSLAGMSQTQLSLAIDIFWAQTVPQVPATIDLNSSEIGLEQPAEIGQGLDDAQRSLSQVRQGIVYYQEAFWGLVGLTILLVLFIILINRNVKAIFRILGSVFATYGIIEAAGLLISRGLIHSQLLSLSDMPQSIQPWLLQFSNSFLNPLLIFSISCAALGITLFVVSFLYHRKQKPSIAS